jgi:3-deoxy-D-manno-octulosonic-acid transferase
MDNFREMSTKFLGAGAAVQVNSAEELGEAWIDLLKDDERASRMGVAARNLVEQNRGATARVLDRIAQVMDSRGSGI